MTSPTLTNKQKEAWDLYQTGMSLRQIARKLDIDYRSAWQRIEGCKKKARMAGADPGFEVERTTRGRWYIDPATGEKCVEYIKTKRASDEELEGQLNSIIDGLTKEIPRYKKVKKPKKVDKDFLNAFIIGDSHLNMYSWHAETGADWSLDIALKRHMVAMLDLVENAEPAAVGILATMGDLLHNDSLKPYTSSNTHAVDVDTRMGMALDAAIAMVRSMIDYMLETHSEVWYVCLRGNHSETMELAIAKMIQIAYEKEPRVKVFDNTSKHIPVVWEQNFLLFTHGDKLNDQSKANIAVGKYRDYHGNAKFTHVLCGHVHHASQKELSGVMVETFPALPTPDAWHCEMGFMTADQSATVLGYHRLGGVSRRYTSFPRIFMG